MQTMCIGEEDGKISKTVLSQLWPFVSTKNDISWVYLISPLSPTKLRWYQCNDMPEKCLKPRRGRSQEKKSLFLNHLFSPISSTKIKWYQCKVMPHWVTRPKNFIKTDTETFFWDQNFRDRDETLFRDQIFLRPIPRLYFKTKCFRDWYRDFFSRPNICNTDTKTFFETDTGTFLRLIPRLFLDQIFRNQA